MNALQERIEKRAMGAIASPLLILRTFLSIARTILALEWSLLALARILSVQGRALLRLR